MAKKIYVVWQGRQTGIFTDWLQCKESIDGFKGAKYKAFSSEEAAPKAFAEGHKEHGGKAEVFESSLPPEELEIIGKPIYPSLAVDAAWDTSSGRMEYRGVDAQTGSPVFRKGPFEDGTNNTGEFLAIVHALAHLKKQGSTIPVYSDSHSAIVWVKNKAHKSKLIPTGKNQELFELLARAVK